MTPKGQDQGFCDDIIMALEHESVTMGEGDKNILMSDYLAVHASVLIAVIKLN